MSSESKQAEVESEPAAPIKRPEYADGDVDQGFSNPMLEKIRRLLTSTDPDKWAIGGPDMGPDLKFARPRPSYEQVLVRDIPNGSLVLHLLQPIQCHYGPGGYSVTAHGGAQYTIEVRDRIFDASKLVDPKFAANFLGKRCEVVASGDIAKSLFIQVKKTIQNFSRQKKREFDEAVEQITQNISSIIESSAFTDWTKKAELVEDKRITTYETSRDGVSIEVLKESSGFEEHFQIVLKRDEFRSAKIPKSLARSCFQKIEEIEQNAQLEKLGSVLKDLGFE